MKTAVAFVAAFALLAGPAHALSCVEPNALFTFQAAMNSPDVYTLLRGSFDFDESLLPGDVTTRGNPNLPPPEPIEAQFTGQGVQADGFTQDMATPVMLQSVCLGPWCGQIGAGQDVMVFAKTDDRGRLLVEVDPCGTWVFPAPTDEMLEQMRACTADPASCATR